MSSIKRDQLNLKKQYENPRIASLESLKELSQAVSKCGASDDVDLPARKHKCLMPPIAREEHCILLKDYKCPEAYQRGIYAVDQIHLILKRYREVIGGAPLWNWQTKLNGDVIFSQDSSPSTPIH